MFDERRAIAELRTTCYGSLKSPLCSCISITLPAGIRHCLLGAQLAKSNTAVTLALSISANSPRACVSRARCRRFANLNAFWERRFALRNRDAPGRTTQKIPTRPIPRRLQITTRRPTIKEPKVTLPSPLLLICPLFLSDPALSTEGYGKRFIVRADEKLTAFVELERAIHEFAVGLVLKS